MSTRAKVQMETSLKDTVHEITKCFPSMELSSRATPATENADKENDLGKNEERARRR